MTNQKQRKPKTVFTPDQKLEYAKLMIEEGYTNQKVMEISTYYDCINLPEFTEEESKIVNNIIKISSEVVGQI